MSVNYFYFADLTQFNPYQKLLGEKLQNKGVSTIAGLPELHRINTLATNVLHLHWEDRIYKGLTSESEAFSNVIGFSAYLKSLKTKGVIIFWTVHNEEPHENKFPVVYLKLRESLLEFSDRIFLHSDYLAKKEWLSPALEKIKIYPHGSYIEYYPNRLSKSEARQILKLSEDDVAFLFIGEMRAYKGLDQLLEAWSDQRIQSLNLKLILAGAGNLGDLIKKHYSGSRELLRIFNDRVPDDKLQVFFCGCDFVVLPFKKVLNSGSVILSLSFGKEVLVPNLPSLERFVQSPGVTYYDHAAASGLIDAITSAARRASSSRVLNAENHKKELITNLPSWETAAQIISDSISEVTAKKNTKNPNLDKHSVLEISSESPDAPYLSIIVFGYKSSDVQRWLKRNKALRSRSDIQIILAFHIRDVEITTSNLETALEGAEDGLLRVTECLSHLHSPCVMLIASDDVVLSLPTRAELEKPDFDFIIGRTFFVHADGHYSESCTNKFSPDVSRDVNIMNYWQFPMPGDNSIYYGIYRERVLRDHISLFKDRRFHALDWAWVHMLFRMCSLKKSVDLMILREKTPSALYTARLKDSFLLRECPTQKELVLSNPLARAFKFIIAHDSMITQYHAELPEVIQGWYHWYSVKQAELCRLFTAEAPFKSKMLSVPKEDFFRILIECDYLETQRYD